MMEDAGGPGGFIPPNLPSPSPTNSSNSSASHELPHPRSHPLRAGSAKEEAARRYVEGRLLHISRRYTKKFQAPEPGEEVRGYVNMIEPSKDLGEIVDVLWLSGTPSLQIPYLLNIALAVTTYLSAFPPAPVATFKLIRKLDHAFASLLKGEDNVTAVVLPGFEHGNRGGMSRTDMVRCKSLVESTRVLIVEVMGKTREVESDETEQDTATETETDMDSMSMDVDSHSAVNELYGHHMDVARVYEATIVQLGELLSSRTGYDVGSGGN